jgi:polyhydroxybutyrate depolymerase
VRTLVALSLVALGCSNPPPPPASHALVVARPYDVNVPASYHGQALPVVVMLHGYSATPFLEEAIYQLTPLSESMGFFYATPSGTRDPTGAPFWNATDACCDMYGSGVDDVAYLNALLDDLEWRFNVDKKRVFFTGHSNGGFMSHRMACDASARVAAIVSLAGATWFDASKCNPSQPVAVAEAHGDADNEVPYGGGPNLPSAQQTVATWAAKDGCAATLDAPSQTLDLVSTIAGAETDVQVHQGCMTGGAAELWTMHGAGHVPNFNQPAWPQTVMAFLLAHARK